MFNAILDLFLRKENKREQVDKVPEREIRTVYRYDPIFDDEEPTIGEAFDLYERKQLCHIAHNGHIKFYIEEEHEYLAGYHFYPKNIFERI